MISISPKTCENCRFLDGKLCKRYPPTVISYSDPEEQYFFHNSVFPEVHPQDGCGEFQAKEWEGATDDC